MVHEHLSRLHDDVEEWEEAVHHQVSALAIYHAVRDVKAMRASLRILFDLWGRAPDDVETAIPKRIAESLGVSRDRVAYWSVKEGWRRGVPSIGLHPFLVAAVAVANLWGKGALLVCEFAEAIGRTISGLARRLLWWGR